MHFGCCACSSWQKSDKTVNCSLAGVVSQRVLVAEPPFYSHAGEARDLVKFNSTPRQFLAASIATRLRTSSRAVKASVRQIPLDRQVIAFKEWNWRVWRVASTYPTISLIEWRADLFINCVSASNRRCSRFLFSPTVAWKEAKFGPSTENKVHSLVLTSI